MYSINNFLKPLGLSERNVQIQDINNNVIWTLNPFTIRHSFINGNLIEIVLYSGNKIVLDFSSTNESQQSILLLQSRVSSLTNQSPLYIDKAIEEYLNSHPIIGPTGADGPIGPTGADGPIGPTGAGLTSSVGGNNQDIQFNNNGVFGGSDIFQTDGNIISIGDRVQLRTNGIGDANWYLTRGTASGNILSSNSFQINVAGGSGEGFEVINTAQGLTLFQLLGINGDAWFKSPHIIIDNIDYYFPSVQGSTNSVLKNDGIGNLSWVDVNTLTPYVPYVNPPSVLTGSSGDIAGQFAIDSGWVYYCTDNFSPIISVTLSVYLQYSGSTIYATYTDDQNLIQPGWIVTEAFDTFGNLLTIPSGTVITSATILVNGSIFGLNQGITGASFSDGGQSPNSIVVVQNINTLPNIWTKSLQNQYDKTLLVSGTSTVIDSFQYSIRSAKYLASCDNPGLSPSNTMTAEFIIANPSDPGMNPTISIYGTTSNVDSMLTFDVRRNTNNSTIEVVANANDIGIYVTLIKQYI